MQSNTLPVVLSSGADLHLPLAANPAESVNSLVTAKPLTAPSRNKHSEHQKNKFLRNLWLGNDKGTIVHRLRRVSSRTVMENIKNVFFKLFWLLEKLRTHRMPPN